MNSRPQLFRVAKWALFLLIAVILLPQPGYRGAPTAVLAPVQYAVDLASLNGQVDPASTVFGLGPLTRLATRAPGVGPTRTLAFDLLVAAALLYGLWLLFRRANSAEALLGMVAAALVVEGVRSYAFPLAVLLWLVLLVVVLDYVQRETVLSLLAAAGLSWLLFYFQSSIGLAALAMLGAALVFRLLWPAVRRRRLTAVALVGWLAAGPLLALLFGIDLPAHLRNALRLRSLVALPAPALAIGKASSGTEFVWLAVTILLIFAGVLVANRRALRGRAVDWLASGLVGVLLLLAFREAFVRPWGHPWLFFQAAAAAVGMVALFLTSREAARRVGAAFVAVLILSFPVVSGNMQGDYLTARLASLRSYGAELLRSAQPAVNDRQLADYVLTPRLLELIGDGTVDATADLLPFIVVNNLAFQPSADIPSPADLPGQIGGVGAPRFIMLGLSDDPAYDPFLAGSPNALDLLRSYRVIWRYGDKFLLLERLNQPRPVDQTDSQTGVARFREEIVLSPPGGIRRVQADLELSFLGRVAQAVALVPQVALVTQYTDDGRDGVRLTTDQLRDGVRLAPVATDLTGLELFSTASGFVNRPVERFWLRTAQPWAFKSQFTYQITSYGAGNAVASDDWPVIELDNDHWVHLAAVQHNMPPGAVTLDVFWEVDPASGEAGTIPAYTVVARLLDSQGNVVATADGSLGKIAPASLTESADPRSFLVARMQLPLKSAGQATSYDLEIGLTPAGQPMENALWRTVLPKFVQTEPQ